MVVNVRGGPGWRAWWVCVPGQSASGEHRAPEPGGGWDTLRRWLDSGHNPAPARFNAPYPPSLAAGTVLRNAVIRALGLYGPTYKSTGQLPVRQSSAWQSSRITWALKLPSLAGEQLLPSCGSSICVVWFLEISGLSVVVSLSAFGVATIRG